MNIGIGTREIRTKRLLLRKFELGDARMMYDNYCSDNEVTKYLMWQTHSSIEVTRSYVEAVLKDYEKSNAFNWAITLGGELIGAVGAVKISEADMCAEIGYCLGKKWWGMGIMTEAARAVIEYLIREAGFHRVSAYHDVKNPASGRVMQKIGMTYEGTLREARFVKGRFVDMAYYSTLENELV